MRSPSAVVSILLFATLTACEQAAPPSEAPGAHTAALSPSPAATPVIASVLWPPAASIDQGALAALPKNAAYAATTSRVPVLVPSRRALLAAPVVVAREHWTSFWAKTEAITVSLMMTRMTRSVPGIPPLRGPHTVRGQPAFITTNEGIWSASWMEHGASYALDVECASPEAPACASDALVRELAAELVYVGGVGADAPGKVP